MSVLLRSPPARARVRSPQASTAGELVVEPPTLISLGFEWYIEGDADRDAVVAVAYRRAGEREWRDSLPLTARAERAHVLRRDALLHGAEHVRRQRVRARREHRVRSALHAHGSRRRERRSAARRQRAHARRAAAVRRRQHVPRLSAGYTGAKQEPAFDGLLAAYYKNALGGDWSRAAPPRVQPGDTILVHAGVYKDFDRFSYSHEIRSQYGTCCGTPWDGTFYLTQDGTAERPIAIKAAGDGEVDLRRRRQQRAVQRHGRGPHVLRRHHVPQHESRHRSRARRASRAPWA